MCFMRKFQPKSIKYAFLTLVNILFFSNFNIMAKDKNIPDFAYPETVKTDASKAMEKNLEKKDYEKALRDALNICIANSLKSTNTTTINLALLDSLAVIAPQPWSGLATLIRADIYRQYYDIDRWNYNNRKLPLDTPWPENMSEWSREMFADTVYNLVSKVRDDISTVNTLNDIPLTNLHLLLSYDKKDEIWMKHISLSDFLGLKGAAILMTFAQERTDQIIPFFPDIKTANSSPEEKCYELRREILKNLLDKNRKQGNDIAEAFIWREYQSIDKERKQDLWDAVMRMSDSPGLALIIGLSDFFTSDQEKAQIYAICNQWIKKYGDTPYAPAVKNVIASLEQQSISIQVPSIAVPQTVIKGTAKVSNVNKGFILLFKVPISAVNEDGYIDYDKFKLPDIPFRTIPLNVEGKVPFDAELEFDIPGLSEGYYVVYPSVSARISAEWKKENHQSGCVVNVSAISLFTTVESNGYGTVYVVDSHNQKPIQGASVTTKKNSYRDSKILQQGTTDKNGAFTVMERNVKILVKYGNNKISQNSYFPVESAIREKLNFSIFTDLSVYRQGDTVEFAVIAWKKKKSSSQLAVNSEFDVMLRDANYNNIDTLTLKTDFSGRAKGKFKIPEDGLLGRYSLVITKANNNTSANSIGDAEDDEVFNGAIVGFDVADYKLPRFYVTVEQAKTDSDEKADSIKFRGKVLSYSGMPLGGATVNYNIEFSPWGRWWAIWTGNPANYSSAVTASPDGSYEISLPVAGLKGTVYEHGTFVLRVTATSPDGETQQAQALTFALGEDSQIMPQIPEEIKISNDSISVNVGVNDMSGFPVRREVYYKIINEDNKTVSEGEFTSPNLKINCADIPSGQYTFEFALSGSDEKTESTTVIYRASDKTAPYSTPLWIPEKYIIADEKEDSVSVTYGSGYPGAWIFYSIKHDKTILDFGWTQIENENKEIKVKIPEGYDLVQVLLTGMHNLERKTQRVNIANKFSLRELKMETVCFRDKLSSGDKERWQFKFTVNSVGRNVYAMAVMTDKALNAIAPFGWDFDPSLRQPFSGIYFDAMNKSIRYASRYFNTKRNIAPTLSYIMPSWQTYGYDFVGTPRVLFMKEAKLYAAASRAYSAGADDFGIMEDAGIDESAEMTLADNNEASIETAEEGDIRTDDIELRPVEMPVAFFMPGLVSDPDGTLSVEFEVPNFNTTWQLQLLGYDRELLSSVSILDAVASKPVMAQGNMPLYLLTGDKTRLQALLFNNSFEDQYISGKIQIFDPVTKKLLLEKDFPAEKVESSANRNVWMDFDVPAKWSQIEIRIMASAGSFSDGERMVVPIYPSSSPVVESTQFYIGAASSLTEVKIPGLPKDANVTLKYCNNPIWECMLALPSVSQPEFKTALSISQALYSNSVALRVAGDYPQIRSNLEKLFSTEEYKDLKSNLELDANLKIVGLNNTPWVNNAQSERERMMNIGSLLDSVAATKTITALCDDLKKLQNSDGGWSWCDGMSSSLFITQEVLLEFGEMNRVGALPDETKAMIDRAVMYCDKRIVEDYSRYKTLSVSSMLEYLYTKSFFNNLPKETDSFATLRKKALGMILDNWKGFSIRDKAETALLFHRTKGYEKYAVDILRSLDQFATKDANKGWWFDNLAAGYGGWTRMLTTSMALNAYAEIDSKSAAVDGLRQWLLLQKETEDWGSRQLTVQVIQSILGSGTTWGDNISLPIIKIGKKELNLATYENNPVITIPVNRDDISGKQLTIIKDGPTPAWGGVICQYIAPMKDVRKTDCENLSITKRVLHLVEGPDGVKAQEGELKVGDKVRITLSIVCDKDMDYVAVTDERGACIQPDEWLSGYGRCGDAWGYRETRDSKTSFFIEFLPKGTHVITYDCHIDRIGEYSTGIATVQSQYAPQNVAHSAGQIIKVKE